VDELDEQAAETSAGRQDERPLAPPDPGLVDETERGGTVVQDRG
jgi:hypothetical protein